MSLTKGHFERDCTNKCRSKQHGDDLCFVITKRCVSDHELCAYLRWRCSLCALNSDSMGRTALHLAASCGRTHLVKWLVKNRGAHINARDLESGYTALHRSIFYGKINTAVSLIQLGANLAQVDQSDLTPIEHAMKDRALLAAFTPHTPCQVYVWGTNTNDTLGTGFQHARQLPDLLDSFHKKYTNVAIQQVCLDKFHCVLVANDGRLFTCGHGQGGRLGLNSESTVLIPQEVRISTAGRQVMFVQATIGRDHSLFLDDAAHVWSCGLNTHHVLGIKPAPTQLLVPRALADFRQQLKGVCAGRFHSVAWGPKGVFTWGLHAGQLGHVRTPVTTFVSPKLVANVTNNDAEITAVAASDGATVVATRRGDIYVLHEYQCRKIASRVLYIDKIVVVGGHLNAKVRSDLLVEKGGKELKVLVLQITGNLWLWQESWPQLSRCIYSLNRPLIVHDAVLSWTELYFITDDGEAFKGEFKPRKKKLDPSTSQTQKKSAFHEFLDKDDCQMVHVTKWPHVHRAVAIQSDLKGRNFAVLQTDPNYLLFDIPKVSPSTLQRELLNLLNESDEMDSMHDVIFKVSGYKFPVHRYIIALNSEQLDSLIESSLPDTTIELSNINPLIFKQILLYIYTGTCDLLKLGDCSNEFKHLGGIVNDPKNKLKTKIKNLEMRDPIRLLQEASKRFGVKTLYKTLDNYIYNNGVIQLKSVNNLHHVNCVKFDRNAMTHLHDVIIKGKTGEISAHKCILAGRLEYFNNLFAVRWNKKSLNIISLPIANAVLDQIITYLYTDESKMAKDDIEHISNVLVVCDQLLMDRLKEICELALSALITLRNAAQMLQFATIHNAIQLKNCVMNFVCLNLSAVLESRILDTIDLDILDDITEYYCNWNPILSKRVITPYFDAPTDELVKHISETFPVKECDQENNENRKLTTKLVKKNTKLRIRKSSENSRPKAQNDSSDLMLTEPDTTKTDPKLDQNWVKILTEKEKHQKIVQARLGAIAIAKEKLSLEKNETNLTKLISSPKIIPKLQSPETSPGFSPGNDPPFCFEPSYEIPIHKAQKLSQKQRKKLAAENSTLALAQQLDKLNQKSSWNNYAASTDMNSFSDIIKADQKRDFPDLGVESPKSPWQKVELPMAVATESPQDGKPDFLAIVADEKKQKDNWTKMRDRPLFFTQMEDRAVRELERFYNIDQVSDEYITIHKVEKGAFAVPLWVHSNTKHYTNNMSYF